MKAQVPKVSHTVPVVASHKKQQPFFSKKKVDTIPIGALNDPLEAEADQLAKNAMRNPYRKGTQNKLF